MIGLPIQDLNLTPVLTCRGATHELVFLPHFRTPPVRALWTFRPTCDRRPAETFGQAQGTQPVAVDVLANDPDPDGNQPLVPSSVTVGTGPQHGSVTVDPSTGRITYTPNAGSGGSDTFKYTVRDDNGATSSPA